MKVRFKSFNLQDSEVLKNNRDELDKIYDLYKLVWDNEYKVIDNANEAPNHGFALNNCVDVLYLDNTPVALTFMRYANLANKFSYEQNWFSEWPKDLLDDIKINSPSGVIQNHFTVHPEFRRHSSNELNIAEILCYISGLHFSKSGEPVMFGEMRKNRSMNRLTELLGGTVYKQSHTIRGLEVQLIGFYQNNLKNKVLSFPNEAKRIFNEGVYYGSEYITNTRNYEVTKEFTRGVS